MKILHTSDWHGDQVTLGVRRLPEIEAAAWETAQKAVDEKCSHYLFTGDLCDPDKNLNVYDTVRMAEEIALFLSDKGIDSFWIAGNHDVIEDGSNTTTLAPLQALRGRIHVLEQPYLFPMSEQVWLLALPFTSHREPYDATAFVEKCGLPEDKAVIIAGHLNITGVVPGEETLEMPRGRDFQYPIKAAKKLAKRGNCVLMVNGHYHQRQVTVDGIHIPGTLAQLTFGESANKPGYFVYEFDGGFSAEEFLVTNPVQMHTVDMAAEPVPLPPGAFVRLKPAPTSTDEEIRSTEAQLRVLTQGVKTLSRPKPKVLLEGKRDSQSRTARELVLKMVEESNSSNKERLREVVEETLAQVGE